jgi:hypothetical protein
MSADGEHARRYPFTTTVLPAAPLDRGGGPELYDAVNECEHGRLPGDKTPPCGCWDSEHRELHPSTSESSR